MASKLSTQKAADEAEKLSKMSDSRQFRDALTRTNGAVQGIRTNALQWMGTSGSK